MGGLVARVGDVVIDGSVRNRLDQIRKQRQI
jgi:F0F1-type ATP synthase delta subunit